MKKQITSAIALAAMVATFSSCGDAEKPKEGEEAMKTAPPAGIIKPVPLPDPQISGYSYPTDSLVINNWINTNNNDSIALHGWGIWTSLNMSSGQQYEGQDLRVFETWLTPQDMQALMLASESKNLRMENVKTSRGKLSSPNQFLHAKKARLKAGMVSSAQEDERVVGFVKYDPTAAQFAVSNKLFDSLVLQSMLDQGKTEIPQFPNTGMTLKPVFEIVTQDTLQACGGYYKLNVWTGLPPKPISYPEGSWPGYVYVDPNNGGQGNGSVDIGGKHRTPQTTYNLNDFVHFKLDKQTAAELKANFNMQAKEGDIAILVAMHVTSKEITRWTWQTYWWAPNADNPPAPSSAAIAAMRPSQLQGAPRHYAMSQAYTFINPNQPLTGGNNIGTSIYAFNPYLEAGFDPGVLGNSAIVITNGKKVVNNYGVLTNCMSCHANANYAPASVTTGPGYLGDTYIDMNSPAYKGTLKLDFAWSIQGNLIGVKR